MTKKEEMDCNNDNRHICGGVIEDYCPRNCHYATALEIVSRGYIQMMKSPLDKYLESILEGHFIGSLK